MSGMEIPAALSIASSAVGAATSIAGSMSSSSAQGAQGEALRISGRAQADAARESAAVQAATAREGAVLQAATARESAAAQVMASREQADAQEFEGRQYDVQAKRIRSAGAVEEAARREDLQSSLETIQVMRAGRGVDLGSPTGRAIARGVTERAERDIMQSKTNYLMSGVDRELAGELARRKARYAVMVGEHAAASGERIATAAERGGFRVAEAAERAGTAAAQAALAVAAAGVRASEAQQQATIIGGIGRAAGIGFDFAKTMRPGIGGFGGYGSGGSAAP